MTLQSGCCARILPITLHGSGVTAGDPEQQAQRSPRRTYTRRLQATMGEGSAIFETLAVGSSSRVLNTDEKALVGGAHTATRSLVQLVAVHSYKGRLPGART